MLPRASCRHACNVASPATSQRSDVTCTSGVLIRLGTKSNSGGASRYPEGADQPVSVRGLIPIAGATREYQSWYRNAAAYCTPSTYTLTNGVVVPWQP